MISVDFNHDRNSIRDKFLEGCSKSVIFPVYIETVAEQTMANGQLPYGIYWEIVG